MATWDVQGASNVNKAQATGQQTATASAAPPPNYHYQGGHLVDQGYNYDETGRQLSQQERNAAIQHDHDRAFYAGLEQQGYARWKKYQADQAGKLPDITDYAATNNFGKGALAYNQKTRTYSYYDPRAKKWVDGITADTIGAELKTKEPELAVQYTDAYFTDNAAAQDQQFQQNANMRYDAKSGKWSYYDPYTGTTKTGLNIAGLQAAYGSNDYYKNQYDTASLESQQRSADSAFQQTAKPIYDAVHQTYSYYDPYTDTTKSGLDYAGFQAAMANNRYMQNNYDDAYWKANKRSADAAHQADLYNQTQQRINQSRLGSGSTRYSSQGF